jgi:hypothetical protein
VTSTNTPTPNEQAPDWERLLNLPVLTTWTAARQREHGADADSYAAALATFQAALRSEHVEGDGRLSAVVRSRRVERHLRALVRHSRAAERAAERLRLAYADHVATLAALPGQREDKQRRRLERKAVRMERRGARRETISELTARSLNKTAAASLGDQAADTSRSVSEHPERPRGLGDLWRKGA